MVNTSVLILGAVSLDSEAIRKKLEGYLGNRWLRQDLNCGVLIPFFLNKARHNLETARLIRRLSDEVQAKSAVGAGEDFEANDWVITCAYYAMYHAASAALASLGLRSTKHEVVIHAVEFHFVHRQKLLPQCLIADLEGVELLDQQYIGRLWAAKKSRSTAQYETDKAFSHSEAHRVIFSAEDFIDRIEKLLTDFGVDLELPENGEPLDTRPFGLREH